MQKYIQEYGYPRRLRSTIPETLEKQKLGRLKYYQNHDVWNKGRPWPEEMRDKSRLGCLNTEKGMGPHGRAVLQTNRKLSALEELQCF